MQLQIKRIVCIKKSHMHAKPWDISLSSIYEVVPLFSIVGGLLFERIGYNVMMYRQLLKAEWDEYQGLESRAERNSGGFLYFSIYSCGTIQRKKYAVLVLIEKC